MSIRSLATFAASFAALYAAHHVGDLWLQTHAQATGKGERSPEGRRACRGHVASLTATKATALAGLAAATRTRLPLKASAAALAVDAASHYWIDRRYTLEALADGAERIGITGKGAFYRAGDPAAAPTGGGAFALDQAAHIAMLSVAAGIVAAGTKKERHG